MERLRAAVVAIVDEQLDMVDTLTHEQVELVRAFNAVATDYGVAQIPEAW